MLRKVNMLQPVQKAIYKGIKGSNGALQFNLQPAHRFCTTCKKKDYTEDPTCGVCKNKITTREGAVFVEVASTTGPNVYDWENKIVFALSDVDIGKILWGVKHKNKDGVFSTSLMHDPGAKTASFGKVKKYMSIDSPDGPQAGCIIRMTEQSGDQKKTHTVPVSGDELVVLVTLLTAAIPRMLAW
jgi:hypothetical protein